MNVTGVLAKGVGAAGIGLMAYDAHHAAKDYSNMYSTRKSTDNLESLYYDTLYLQTPSVLKDKAKKSVLNLSMDYNIDRVFYKIGGYVKSMTASAINNVIPMGLAALALFTKGAVSKASALGLIGYGVLDFMSEFGHHPKNS
jgi:hypothetical protein